MSEQKFQVGDRVKAFGVEGVVEDAYGGAISVKMAHGSVKFFQGGKYFDWAKTISLKRMERPKKKKKITVWVAIGGPRGGEGPERHTGWAYPSKKMAEERASVIFSTTHYGVYPVEIEVDDE